MNKGLKSMNNRGKIISTTLVKKLKASKFKSHAYNGFAVFIWYNGIYSIKIPTNLGSQLL